MTLQSWAAGRDVEPRGGGVCMAIGLSRGPREGVPSRVKGDLQARALGLGCAGEAGTARMSWGLLLREASGAKSLTENAFDSAACPSEGHRVCPRRARPLAWGQRRLDGGVFPEVLLLGPGEACLGGGQRWGGAGGVLSRFPPDTTGSPRGVFRLLFSLCPVHRVFSCVVVWSCTLAPGCFWLFSVTPVTRTAFRGGCGQVG